MWIRINVYKYNVVNKFTKNDWKPFSRIAKYLKLCKINIDYDVMEIEFNRIQLNCICIETWVLCIKQTNRSSIPVNISIYFFSLCRFSSPFSLPIHSFTCKTVSSLTSCTLHENASNRRITVMNGKRKQINMMHDKVNSISIFQPLCVFSSQSSLEIHIQFLFFHLMEYSNQHYDSYPY